MVVDHARYRDIGGAHQRSVVRQVQIGRMLNVDHGQKNWDIQVVRAVAILMVMVQHVRNRLPTPTWYHELFSVGAFWSGVDIFFAISGFLICATFVRDVNREGSGAIRSFWVRRFWRLFPALLIWVAASVAVAAFTTSVEGAQPHQIALSGLAALFGFSNVFWVECIRSNLLIPMCGNPDFNGVSWSLSLEWQLYALLTFLTFLIGKWRGVAALLFVSLFASTVAAPSFSYPWALRPQAFTLGALLALINEKQPLALKLPNRSTLALSMLLIGTAICIISPVRLQQPLVVPALAFGGLLCLASSWRGGSYSSGRIGSILVWIGERSYSIYLSHLPLILLSREITARTVGLQVSALSLLVGFGTFSLLLTFFADLSYKLIEVPFQRRGRRAPLIAPTQSLI